MSQKSSLTQSAHSVRQVLTAYILCDEHHNLRAIMTNVAATLQAPDHLQAAADRPKLDTPPNPLVMILFFGFLAAGILYMAYSVYVDVDASGAQPATYLA